MAAVCAYSIVKYGLFGYINELEKDGRWDAVEAPNPSVSLTRGEFTFDAALKITTNRAQFHIGSAFLTGEPRLDAADHIQSRVLGRLGAFASIFYNETSLFKSPAVNVPDDLNCHSEHQGKLLGYKSPRRPG
ncbi:hypothetical protein GJ496_001962 [Pomphorhynchus laevis]|nr:hypothetical protein GJ496_001962 [Pomphorhynchus laevis]